MPDNAEHLETILLKDNLSKTDVVNLLAGHRITWDRGYGDGSKAYDLITGKQVTKDNESIFERWRSLEGIWESSSHNRTNIQLALDPKADDLMVPRNYVIKWARDKAIKPKGGAEIFEGFRQCLQYALDKKWIIPQDWEQAEKEAKRRETSAKLDQLLGTPRKGKGTASDYYDKDGAPKEESADTVRNRHRLIGLMAEMLQDKDLVSHLPFTDQTAIGDYIENNYADKYKGKGLKAETIKKILGKANGVLKSDEEV